MKLLITILVKLLMLSTCTYTAKAVRVSNGNAFTVLTDNKKQIRIRLEDTFYEVFMTLEWDGIVKVEMPENKKKLALYIGYMVRLNELEGLGLKIRG
jgi:cell division protein YceG involved in septum cleavage